jgi:hypothetical protein
VAFGRPRSPSPLGVLLEGARDASARAGGVVVDRVTWQRVVGTRIASRTEPGRLRSGVLTVHVASAAWAQELSFFTAEMLERLRGIGLTVNSIRFQVRPVARTAVRTAPVPALPRAKLPEALVARLERVTDPALRAAIAEAASLGLARPEAASSGPRARAPRGAAARNVRPGAGAERPPGATRRKP